LYCSVDFVCLNQPQHFLDSHDLEDEVTAKRNHRASFACIPVVFAKDQWQRKLFSPQMHPDKTGEKLRSLAIDLSRMMFWRRIYL